MLDRSVVLTLVGILLALFLGALDQTIVSTALPKIVEDLHGLDRYAWVATTYLLASTALVPIYGRLADIMSKKTIEIFAVVTFLVGSALCGLSGELGPLPLIGDGMNQLILFRAVQGVGGAGLFAMAFIVIADLFPPKQRGKFQGLVGATFGISSVIGPFIGGLLTDHGGALVDGVEGWRWVFYVNLPFGGLALWFLLAKMPPLPPRGSGKLDVLGALLLVAGLVPLTLGLSLDKQKTPWDAPETIALLVAGAVFVALFSARTIKSAHPILDFSLFKIRTFSTSNLALFLLGGTFLGLVVFLPLFLVNVAGVSATRAGTSLIPLSLGLVFGAIASGQITSRVGRYKGLMLGGFVVMFVGVGLLTQVTSETSANTITLLMIVCGLGIGPSFPTYTLAVQNAVDFRHIGQATSATQFFRQVGGTLAIALMGTLFSSTVSARLAAAMPPGAAAPDGATAPAEGAPTAGGIEGIERAVRARFAAERALVRRALVDGDPAAKDAVMANPRTPPELKDALAKGGPVPVLQAENEAALARLERALLAGDGAAVDDALGATALPAMLKGRLRALLGAPPDEVTKAMVEARVGSAALIEAQRAAITAGILANVDHGLDAAVEETVSELRATLRSAFTDGLVRVFTLTLLLIALAFVVTLRVPDVPLRSTMEGASPPSVEH